MAKNGYSTTFTSDGVFIKSLKNNIVYSEGRRIKGLYALVKKAVQLDATSYFASTANDLQLYRERLGQQNKLYVKEFLKQLNTEVREDNDTLCDGCARGKMHRLPFNSKPRQTEAVGELIHADLKGPMSETSLGGAKYFICFKDYFLFETIKTKSVQWRQTIRQHVYKNSSE